MVYCNISHVITCDTKVNMMFVILATLSVYPNIHTAGKLEKYAWPRWESNIRPLEY